MVFSNRPLQFIIATLVACLPLLGFANTAQDTIQAHTETTEAHHEAHGEPMDLKSKIEAYKMHHVLDAHDFTLFSDEAEGKHYGFPLPIILWDNGLQIFSSSKFNHGESVAESNGNYYKIGH